MLASFQTGCDLLVRAPRGVKPLRAASALAKIPSALTLDPLVLLCAGSNKAVLSPKSALGSPRRRPLSRHYHAPSAALLLLRRRVILVVGHGMFT